MHDNAVSDTGAGCIDRFNFFFNASTNGVARSFSGSAVT